MADKWNDIKIETSGGYVNLHINGVNKGGFPNTNRRARTLNVYASDSHSDAANAWIRDFALTNIQS